ncbi:uncharacterized protein SAPINGB_P003191 [Magnusiomyces paraingens]|uniref:PPIase cyclophilin-type domain-containing protein n=1 Tax=Magnusiomyces paraingens TaxID=2606893 RepID=A0A5E8BLE8_9ASCO|nr:uncharacterized protein SAPINGB_P003191 [Saprochaete ingens]VVT51722.1 unnamed protein product [Saprochaete ingens]
MGKNTDKLFITHSEWAQGNHASSSGKKTGSTAPSQLAAALPFWTCSVSQQPVDPSCAVCDLHGNVFDLKNVMPYILRQKINPVTREPLERAAELIKLKLAKNDQGKYVDPVTFKEFQTLSDAVVIKSSGNVYFMSTIKEMCLKTGNLVDLVSEKPFIKSDIIHLRGGAGVQKKLEVQQPNPKRPLQQIAHPDVKPPTPGLTTHHLAASVTSTSVDISTESKRLGLPLERLLVPKRYNEPGYAVLSTSLGEMTLELWPKYSPIAVYNFLALARSNYYNNTIFHRNVRGFMIQGGDPTGTGTGGKSCAELGGKPIKDETNTPYKHDTRGILSMANRGKNTATSQFFMTYRRAPHLDGKHTIFGKIIKGLDVLDAMERTDVDSQDRPLKKIEIYEIRILQDPFVETKKEEPKEEPEVDDSPWLKKSSAQTGSIGKYIKARPASAIVDNGESNWKIHKKRKTTLQKSSFSGW